ncbi:cupin domain-containing protein [Methanococcoides seepicolus]|uniref:Cupin domain-containing protein n=1 Tax=Methanococcoides seepicolus TaxID=2828780 RepID=A0A9E5DBX4_9EURY|nr:cupin domain-containing protein [Methanococcoides seepicolus]MCM1986878.1 cupin domain-containing protein [Methanococcoides seepicolus]
MKIRIQKIDDTEGLETPEGVMKPLLFGERLLCMHLEIPAGLEVSPHAHPTEGIIYCLSGELVVESGNETVTIGSGTAMLVPPDTVVGIKNQQNAPVNAILVSSPPSVKSVEELKNLLRHHDEGDKS